MPVETGIEADLAPSANCEEGDDDGGGNFTDDEDVPIAQQLGILPRLQKSGDAIPTRTVLFTN
jgi:hypothetical protein